MRTTHPATLAASARRFTSLILAFLCVASTTLSVFAQDPTQPQQNGKAQDATDQPVSRPIPQRTIGLEPGKVVRWTMRDAVMAALEKSVDIELERESVKLVQYDIFALQGFYDPVTSSSIGYARSTQPNVFRFSGADEGVTTTQNDSVTYNFGLAKNIERYGSVLQFNFENDRRGSNTNNLSLQYSPSMTVNITQPLFKNFNIDTNRHALRIAKKNLDLSDALFRQRAIEIISQVQQAYWDLALAIRNEEVARSAVKLAETQLDNNKRQVEVGTLAPIDVVSAAASLENNRQNVFAVMNQVAQAENALKSYTVTGPGDDLWNARIEPVESFEIKPFVLPLADAVKLAQENRPEVKQYVLRKEMNKIDIDFFRNQAKPQIDLVGSYGTNGVGGTPGTQTQPTSNCGGGIPFDQDGDGNPETCLTPSGVSAGTLLVTQKALVTGTSTQPFNVSPNFVGGYGTALRNLFSNDFRTWSFGVRFNFPLRNRTAQANLGRAREQERQLDLQTRRQLQNIEVEVRNGVQAVEMAKMRSEAARSAREYAKRQLEGEEKRFAAGLVGTFFVLQRRNELTQAQFTELSALADYNKSVAMLQRVISTTLSSNNIEIKSDVPPVK